jgi:hypothetical protein
MEDRPIANYHFAISNNFQFSIVGADWELGIGKWLLVIGGGLSDAGEKKRCGVQKSVTVQSLSWSSART